MRVAVVVGLLAACHGSHPATGDAGGPGGGDAMIIQDAALDASDAPSRGTITVTVYGDGLDRDPGVPVPGATVYFVSPDNTSTSVITGSDGVATAQEPNNTTVWVIHHDGTNNYDLETFEGVQIGDSITSGNPTPPGPDTFAGTAYVAFPSFSDATLYHLTISCTTGPTSTSASVFAQNFFPCPQEMTANALVWATDSMGNLGYTSATGIDLTAHASAATELALPAFQPGATISINFTNLPSAMGESSADLYARYTSGTDPTFLQDVELREDTLTDTMTASSPIAPFGDHTRVLGLVNIGGTAYAYHYDGTTAGLSSSVTLDASTMVHPASTGQYDSATKTLSWQQQAFGVDPTVVRATLGWNDSGTAVGWYITAPYSGSPSLGLPAFPSDLPSALLPSQIGFRQVDLTSYAGKAYHDILVGQADGAPSWDIVVGP